MKKNALLVSAMAVALSMSIVACSGNGGNTTTSDNSSSTTQSETKGGDFDAVEAYYGQWRGAVETTGESVYGTAGGVEMMLDVNLEKDGTCSVEPLEAHADLLTEEGTWDAVEGKITLHLSTGDIEMTVDGDTATADASAFDIADFDEIKFDFYG